MRAGLGFAHNVAPLEAPYMLPYPPDGTIYEYQFMKEVEAFAVL